MQHTATSMATPTRQARGQGTKRGGRLGAWVAAAVLWAGVVGTMAGGAPRVAHAQQIQTTSIAMKIKSTVAPNGNARLEASMTFNPPQAYDRIKAAYPNLYVLFRDFGAGRASFEIDKDTLQITPNDAKRSITFAGNLLGYAVCRGTTWEIELEKNEDIVTEDANKVFTSVAQVNPDGTSLSGTSAYVLPATATNVRVDKERSRLTYSLPHTKAATASAPSVDVMVRTKKRLMSSLYKIYADNEVGDGQYWVAKTIVKNTGATPIYDLKITYKMGEYCEASVPDRYGRIMPKGAAVSLYYPVIASRVTQLRSQTPLDLHVTYEYKDASGKTHQEEESKRVTMLGLGQFEFSNLSEEDTTGSWKDNFNNAPLLAAFVTKVDEPVKQFAGFVSEMAGGAAAASDDKDAIRWMRAAYELQRLNNVVYQTPSSGGFGQDIKMPRDVFRDKSGTCVDLAITYAALAEAVGLDAHLMLVPGHCFAVVRLPKSGNLVAVENTGLGGGENRATFDQAVEIGLKELNEYAEKGLFYFVDVSREQAEGRIPLPELPALETTFLEKVGIKRVGGSSGFDGHWIGTFGAAELTLSLTQNGNDLKGKMMLRGRVPVNEDVTATVGKDNSIKIKKRTQLNGTDVEIELNGIKNGDTIAGTYKITQRLLFGIKGDNVSGDWTVKRSWD